METMNKDEIQTQRDHFEAELKLESETVGRMYLKGILKGLKIAAKE